VLYVYIYIICFAVHVPNLTLICFYWTIYYVALLIYLPTFVFFCRIRGLVHGDTPNNVDPGVWLKELMRLGESLREQVTDRRSAIVKAACNAIGDMAELLGDAFDPAATKVTPALLKNTIVTIAVISNSSDLALQRIIAAADLGMPHMAPKVLEALRSRSGPMRLHAIGYLAQMLQNWAWATSHYLIRYA
jgi:hypothetical protein